MGSDDDSYFKRYWWVFAGALAAVSLATALNISNTDGWIVVSNTSSTAWVVDFNTTRGGDLVLGNVTINGELVLNNTVYDDMVIPLLSARVPTTSPADCETPFIDGTIACSFSKGEQLYGTLQMTHRYKLGSLIDCHVHVVKPNVNAGVVVMGLEYTTASVFGVFGSTSTNYCSFNSTSAFNHSICDFGSIGSFSTISGVGTFHLFRNTTGDTYGSDVFGLSLDCHAEMDTLGSDEEYVK